MLRGKTEQGTLLTGREEGRKRKTNSLKPLEEPGGEAKDGYNERGSHAGQYRGVARRKKWVGRKSS